MHNYGDRITWILKAKGSSWKELGEKTKISQSTLSHCKKINRFTTEQLESIAAVLGMSIAELVDFDNEIGRQKGIVEQLKHIHKELGDRLKDID